MPPHRRGPLWFGLPFVGAALSLLAFHLAGAAFAGGFSLDLGSLFNPGPRYAYFLMFWVVLGSLAVAALAVGLVRATSSDGAATWVATRWAFGSDRAWIVAGCVAAFILAVLVRRFLLHDAALTDDESAYRFQAQLLATGRLAIPSPVDKIFFDNNFLINDGRLYSQYFLGWPALQLPGVLLGVPGYTNAAYSALTVPALFLLLRRFSSSGWARGGLLLYLCSPMVLVAAATEMSHVACTMALSWTLWLAVRSRDQGATPLVFFALAVTFCVAFFIRPISAVAVGLPWIGWVMLRLRDREGAGRLKAAVAFLVPATAMALLFLLINKLLNGGWLTTGYARYLQYVGENAYRFTALTPELTRLLFNEGDIGLALATMGNAFLRFNFALFGWPFSVLFVFLAPWRRAAVLWLSFCSYFVLHCWHNSAGIDSFGPVHYYELCICAIALTVIGLQRLQQWIPAPSLRSPAKLIPAALVAAFVGTSLAGYLPVRLRAVRRIADNINQPSAALSRQGITNAVVFSPGRFIDQRCIAPTRHHRLFRPNNHPELRDDVLWVNSIDAKSDSAFMRHFPRRTGYRMVWREDCRVEYRALPLSTPALPRATQGQR